MQTSPQQTQSPAWQQALNPQLVQRLWRPARQAGLIQTRQAQALLARHQTMTTQLPLAALLQRGGGAMWDADAAQTPIVYAQPVMMNDTVTEPAQPAKPIERVMNSAPTIPIEMPIAMPIATPSPRAAASGASQPMVIQRKMAPGATASASSPQSVVAPSTRVALPFTLSGIAPMATSATMLSETNEAQTVMSATRTSDALFAPSALPVVYPAPLWVDGAAPNVLTSVSTPVSTPALPVIQINPEANQSSATPFTAQASSLPLQTQATSTPLPIVREQPTPESATNPMMPGLHARMPLPLVEVAQTRSQTATTAALSSMNAQQTTPAPQPITTTTRKRTPFAQANQANQANQPTQRAQLTQSPQPNTNAIVDKVHRKFLRRLTSEAERRGMR